MLTGYVIGETRGINGFLKLNVTNIKVYQFYCKVHQIFIFTLNNTLEPALIQLYINNSINFNTDIVLI